VLSTIKKTLRCDGWLLSLSLGSYNKNTFLQWVFLPEPPVRKKLVLPPPVKVDYRATCFCHRELIDIGFVCSVCLSSKFLSNFEFEFVNSVISHMCAIFCAHLIVLDLSITLTHCCRAGLLIKYPLVTRCFKRF